MIFFIKLYQIFSRLFYLRRRFCRFELSCSEYAILVIKKYGYIRGMLWVILRLIACQPYIKVPWTDKVQNI